MSVCKHERNFWELTLLCPYHKVHTDPSISKIIIDNSFTPKLTHQAKTVCGLNTEICPHLFLKCLTHENFCYMCGKLVDWWLHMKEVKSALGQLQQRKRNFFLRKHRIWGNQGQKQRIPFVPFALPFVPFLPKHRFSLWLCNAPTGGGL